MCECADVWMCGCVDVWMCGFVDVRICGCADLWMCGLNIILFTVCKLVTNVEIAKSQKPKAKIKILK